MVQIGYNSTAPNPQQLLAQNNSAPVVPETMQSTEPMMSVDPSMVKPDPVVAKKPTNQFDYAANIGAIPGVNTYSPAENPIFKTQIFKDSIAKQRAIPDAIKDFTSGMPKEEFANYYKEFKAEDAEWISKLSEDLKGGIPYSKIREFYPEIDEYGLKNLEKTIKSDEYLSDLRLDGETQLLSNEMKGLDPTIDYLGPIFEGNSKENLSEYGFGGIVIEGGKLIANIVPAAINSLLLFPINAITQPVNTVKMLGKLPKAAKLGFKQAWDDTEGMSDAERVQTMVSLGMDFITENPDIIFAPEAIFAKGGLASKGASLARRVVSNVGERGQKFINAAGNVQDTLKWEDKVIQGAKQGFEAAFEKEKKAPSNVSQETKDLLYTALPPRAKNLKYMTAVEYKESIPEALKSLFTNRDNLQVMPDPDTGAIKGLFQGDKIAKMNDTELVKNIVGAADTTLKDTWDIILEVGDQAAADGILGNTKDIVANIDNVLDNMQIGNTKILNTDTKTIRMLGEFRNQLLQNGGNIDIKTLQSLSQRLNKFWKEGDPMMIAAAEEINKLLRPLITDVGMQVLDNLNLSSIKKQWGGLRNLTDNFEALSKYAEKYPSPNVFQKANDLWSKIQAVKGAARILSGDPSGALDLGAAVMQNMGGAQLKGFDRIKGFAKGFRNMADHVGDTKIPGGYGRGYVKNLIKARINNTPKLGYTPEATPMMTPEGTINQTIVTAPEKKGGYMQTDITKPGAIKTLPDNPTDGTITNEGTAAGEVGQAESAMKEVSGTQSSPTKSNGPDGGDSGKGNEIGQYLDSGLYDTYEDFDILGNIPREDIVTLREVNPNITDVEIVKMYEEGKKAMDNAMKNEFTELDMNYAKEIRKLNEEEQRIGTIAGKEINAEATAKQVSDREANRNLVRERMQADYGLDEEAILQKMDELDGKDINEPYKQKSKYVPAAERKIRREERLQKKLDKARRPATTENPPLYEEARKYKSAEEFVKAQGKPFYHGTNKKLDKLTTGNNRNVSKSSIMGKSNYVFVTDNKDTAAIFANNRYEFLGGEKNIYQAYIDGDAKILDFGKTNDTYKSTLESLGYERPIEVEGGDITNLIETPEFVKRLNDAGYSGVSVYEKGGKTIAILDDNLVKTESQLKQIREEAQSTVKSTDESLMEEARKYKSAEEFANSKKTVYHGTPDFRFSEEFDANKPGYYKDSPEALADNEDYIKAFGGVSKGFSSDRPIYFTDNRGVAGSYSNKPAYDYRNSIPKILDRKLVMNNPLEVDAKGMLWRKFETNIDGVDIKGTYQLEEFAKSKGYDGIIVKNVDDPYSTLEGKPKNSLGTNYVVFDAKQVKTESQLKQIREEANSKGLKPKVSEGLKATVKAPEEALIVEARKYKSAEEFVKAERNKLQGKVDELNTKQKKNSKGGDATGYDKARDKYMKDKGIVEPKDNNYEDIDKLQKTYEDYKSRGQDMYAKQQKELIDDAVKNNELIDKHDKAMEEWFEYYPKHEKEILMENNKWMTEDEADFIMMIKHDNRYNIDNLKQIREEANQSRRKDLPTN